MSNGTYRVIILELIKYHAKRDVHVDIQTCKKTLIMYVVSICIKGLKIEIDERNKIGCKMQIKFINLNFITLPDFCLHPIYDCILN